MRERRFIAGDPLRAVAALTVLVYHAAIYARGGRPPRSPADVEYGDFMAGVFGRANQGVILFFVLSGYLISRPFVRALIEDRGLPAIPVYVRNRLLRIVPLFWAFVALGVLRHGLMGAGPAELLAILGFAQVHHQSALSETVFPHAWTLDAEMAFYLAIPLIAALMAIALRGRGTPGGRALAIAALCLAAGAVSIYLRSRTGPGTPEYPWLLAMPFVPGILLAIADVRFAERLEDVRFIPVIAVAMVIAGVLGTGYVPPIFEGPTLGRITRPLAAGLVVGGALLLQWGRGRTWSVLDNPVMRWLGARGYGIYLFQILVMLELEAVCRDLGGYRGLALMLGVSIPLTLLLADLGHRFVERPALARKRRSTASLPPSR